jgi:hypothetical protein
MPTLATSSGSTVRGTDVSTEREELVVDPPPESAVCGYCKRTIKTLDAHGYKGFCECGATLSWSLDPYDGWVATIGGPPRKITIRPRE